MTKFKLARFSLILIVELKTHYFYAATCLSVPQNHSFNYLCLSVTQMKTFLDNLLQLYIHRLFHLSNLPLCLIFLMGWLTPMGSQLQSHSHSQSHSQSQPHTVNQNDNHKTCGLCSRVRIRFEAGSCFNDLGSQF